MPCGGCGTDCKCTPEKCDERCKCDHAAKCACSGASSGNTTEKKESCCKEKTK